MKKTKKRILGLLGLILVAITTIFAVFLPGPGASATGGTSLTDTIVVRVVGENPVVEISGIENRSNIVFPNQSIHIEYENVETVSFKIFKDGGEDPVYSDEINDANYTKDTKDYPLNLLNEPYGYGEYLAVLSGISCDGTPVEASLIFYFYPVTGEIEENKSDDLAYLNLNYDTDNEEIDTIKINIYDENGNLVNSISPITVKAPGVRTELPFSESGLPTGNYKIAILAYNAAGELLYGKPYTLFYYYEEEVIPVPDTGSPFINSNISTTDYLITGLLIFLSAAGVGLVFAAKNRGRKAHLGRKRK